MDYRAALAISKHLRKNIIIPSGSRVKLVGSLCRYQSMVKNKKITISAVPKMKDIDLLVIMPNKSYLDKPIDFKNTVNSINTTNNLRRRRFLITNPKTKKKVHVDVFITTKKELPYALLHYIGSKFYNIRLRAHTKNKLGLLLNQYGLYRDGKQIPLQAKTDLDILRYLKVHLRPIWNRER